MAEITPEHDRTRERSIQQAVLKDGYVIPGVVFEAPYRDNGSGRRVTGYEGVAGYEIEDIDGAFAKIRVTDTSAIADALADIAIIVPITIPRIDLPDVLTGITVTYNISIGEGDDSHPSSQQSFTVFGSGSGSLTPSSSSQGSATVIPDIQPEIVQRYCQNVPAQEVTFYLSNGSSMQDVLDRLTILLSSTVLAWPQFRPVAHTITVKGQQVSLSAKADTKVSGGGTLDSGQAGYEWGNGSSVEKGVTVKSVRLPPTIHGAITISDPTESATAEATAEASTPIFAPGSAGEQPAITNTKSISQDAEASVTPTSLAATTPFSAIPSSGLRLYSLNPGPVDVGDMVIFQAAVVDFADL